MKQLRFFTVTGLSLLTLHCTGLAEDLPATPPAPSAPRKVAFPVPREKTLANGLRVIVVERPWLPLISAKLLVKAGAEADPAKKAGLANITASLLTRGTETRTAPQIAEAVEQLGGTLESGAEWDDSYLRLTTLSSQAEPALQILADAVRHPVFQGEELERLRAQLLDQLQVDLRAPANLARYAMAKVVFGNGPYGHPPFGTPASLARIKRGDAVDFYTQNYRPDNSVCVISGNITPDDGFAMIDRIFGDWKVASLRDIPKTIPTAGTGPAYKPRTVVIDMPTAGQAAVMLGKPGIARNSADFFAGEVANAVLGTGYSSRLNEEIRIKRGLSYGAESRLDARRATGPFITFAQTMNEAAGIVTALMKQQVDGLSRDIVGGEELNTRKATLAGEFGRRLETNDAFAAEAGRLALYGIPLDSVNSYISNMEAVTADDVKTFAAQNFPLDRMSVVVVGNAALLQKALKDQLKGAEVIKSSALDFETASLRLPAKDK